MPEYLTPGVYIEEFEIGAKPIEGVSTSTAGFLGETERGPTSPQLVTSWLQFQRIYGSYIAGPKQVSYLLAYAVEGFFTNGGKRCYIGRITASDARSASLKLTKNGENALTVKAVGEGSWGQRVVIKLGPATLTTPSNLFKLSVFYWKDSLPDPLFDPEKNTKMRPQPTIRETWDNLSVDPNSPDYYGKKVNGISNLIIISKQGNDTGDMPDGFRKDTASLKLTKNGENALTVEAVGRGPRTERVRINLGSPTGGDNSLFSLSVFFSKDDQPDPLNDLTIEPIEFYEKLSVDPASPHYYEKVVNKGNFKSNLIILSKQAGDSGETPDWPKNRRALKIDPSGTSASALKPLDASEDLDGKIQITSDDYKRDKPEDDIPGKRKGLTAFKEIDEISIIYVPNAYEISKELVNAVITHCEDLKSRFAIIDAKQASGNVGELDPRSDFDTKYAAFYYPWIKIVDPITQMEKLVPPGGHVAGIYARSDIERGVHKAPANEVMRGATDLQFQITGEEQGILNPRGVNVIRAFPGRGIRVWGARTLSSDTLWKYINVRRLFIYIEESIERGTQWVVFEPNNEKLWARVRATITQFLTTVWKDGALMGTKVEEAFFVKCDRTTMTQDEIDNGKLICIIGIAPVKPAEFVIFRIAQWAGGSAATE